MNYLIIVLFAALSGCSTFSATKDVVSGQFDKINEEAVASSKQIICRKGSVGAIQDEFGKSRLDAAAWRQLCLPSGSEGLIQGPK